MRQCAGPGAARRTASGHKPYLAGKPVTEIESQARAFFWEKVCPRISEDARRVIEEHQAQNHHVVFLTGSPDFLVEPLATFVPTAGLWVTTMPAG